MIQPAVAALMFHIIFLQQLIFTRAKNISESDQFIALINDCTCQGYNSIYQCIVFGGVATVWKGTAFNCASSSNEVIMFHSHNSTLHACNNGTIIGRIINVDSGTYTSQLTVPVSVETNGSTIVCAHDTGGDTPVIGSALLRITTVPFPPPSDVNLIEETRTHLRFNWSRSQNSLNCPSIFYQIVASNCGQCPDTTTNTTVTCFGNYTQLMSSRQCSFAVQAVVCDNIIGDVSIAVTVTVPITEDPDHNSSMMATDDNLRTESGVNIIRLNQIISATITPVIVLVGITLVLGLVLVYLIAKKSKSSRNTNQQSTPARVNMTPNTTNNNKQEIGIYSYLQSAEDQDQNPNSRTTAGVIIYTDLDPNTVKANYLPIEFSSDDRVQYEEIRHETGAQVCEPSTGDKVLVNLDLLLILLKEELTPRWYEFGLVVGVPKDIVDSYLGYASDQCLIELFDYWLRHHPGQLTWREVAQALSEIKLYQLAEKALQISTTGKFTIDPDIKKNNVPIDNNPPPDFLHTPANPGAAGKVTPTFEYEDTAGLLPPPLPPKHISTQ